MTDDNKLVIGDGTQKFLHSVRMYMEVFMENKDFMFIMTNYNIFTNILSTIFYISIIFYVTIGPISYLIFGLILPFIINNLFLISGVVSGAVFIVVVFAAVKFYLFIEKASSP